MIYLILTIALFSFAATLRLLYIFRPSPPQKRSPGSPIHLLIVLGSGGHTAEMLAMLQTLDPPRYTHRTYILSSGDDFSSGRARAFEDALTSSAKSKKGAKANGAVEEVNTASTDHARNHTIYTVPRARKIHQSLLTTPFSCLHTLLCCLRILYFHPQGYPDLILTNGPATSVVVILAALILKYFSFPSSISPFTFRGAAGQGKRDRRKEGNCGAVANDGATSAVRGMGIVKRQKKRRYGGDMKRIHIESWARTRTPSLTLRIVRWGGLCDRVLVHWKRLEEEGWGEWMGDLII